MGFGDAAQAGCVVACGLDLNVSGVLVLWFHYFFLPLVSGFLVLYR